MIVQKKKQIKRKKDRKRKRPAKISKRHLFQFSNCLFYTSDVYFSSS